MAHGRLRGFYGPGARDKREPLTWGFTLERVTGIEPALSAWEVCGAPRVLPADSVTCGDLGGLSVSDRDYPWVLLPSGTQRARLDPLVKPLVSLRWTSCGLEIGDGCWYAPPR
jgi:hypothetical protein